MGCVVRQLKNAQQIFCLLKLLEAKVNSHVGDPQLNLLIRRRFDATLSFIVLRDDTFLMMRAKKIDNTRNAYTERKCDQQSQESNGLVLQLRLRIPTVPTETNSSKRVPHIAAL
jgi:hypothetical protein